jgi:hypothetical protein
MEYILAQGVVKEGKQLNYLVIRDEETGVEKTVAYNISYKMEKLIRQFVDTKVKITLRIEEID